MNPSPNNGYMAAFIYIDPALTMYTMIGSEYGKHDINTLSLPVGYGIHLFGFREHGQPEDANAFVQSECTSIKPHWIGLDG